MNNTAIKNPEVEISREDLKQYYDDDVVDREPCLDAGEPLYGDFINEIEVWARRALASSGFGDF